MRPISVTLNNHGCNIVEFKEYFRYIQEAKEKHRCYSVAMKLNGSTYDFTYHYHRDTIK